MAIVPLPTSEPGFGNYRKTYLKPLITPALVAKLFHTVEYTYKDANQKTHPASIKVSEPVSVTFEGRTFYVPVTPPEAFKLAKDCGAVPLTRAISDQAFKVSVANQAFYSKGDPNEPNMSAHKTADKPDFVRWSQYLGTKYLPHRTKKLPSGLHKVWILSSEGLSERGVNHGFHIDRKYLTKVPSTPTLDPPWSVIQNLNADHDKNWWDYSQLLQMMKDLTVDGQKMDLLDAIETGHPSVWDEGATKRIRADQQLLIDPEGPLVRHAKRGFASGDPATILGTAVGLAGVLATPLLAPILPPVKPPQ